MCGVLRFESQLSVLRFAICEIAFRNELLNIFSVSRSASRPVIVGLSQERIGSRTKPLARDLKQLREIQTSVRGLVEQGLTPRKIIKVIREDDYVKRLLDYVRKDTEGRRFNRTQIAMHLLEPWLPEKMSTAILGEIFDRTQSNVRTSLRRYKRTLPAIAEALDWARRGGTRLSYLAKQRRNPAEGEMEPPKTFSESGAEWRWLARLMPADGFDPYAPSFGYRRPSEKDKPLDWNVDQLQGAIRQRVQQNPRLEKTLRSRETRWDPEKGPKMREACLQVIQGWNPVTAMKYEQVGLPKTTFLGLLRNPRLCGMVYDSQGELWVLKTDQSILSGTEFVLLQIRTPRRGAKQLFGLVWENGIRVVNTDTVLNPDASANSETGKIEPELIDDEVWIVDVLFTMHIDLQMGFTRIAQVTGFQRDTVRQMFERTEYKAIVGEERWNEARSVNTLHARVEHGKEVRKRIL